MLEATSAYDTESHATQSSTRAGLPSEHWPRPDTFGHERVRVRWQELATDEKRQEREAIEKKMKRECQRGTEAGQATTDQFKCGRCGQRKVSPEAQSMNNAACNDVLPPRRLRSTRTSRHGTRRESATWPTCDCMQHAAYDTQHAPHDTRHATPTADSASGRCAVWLLACRPVRSMHHILHTPRLRTQCPLIVADKVSPDANPVCR